jgi:uncharacterized protein YcbX
MIRVESLHIYPIKSTAVIDLPQSIVTPQGLLHDRSWLIVDPKGHFLTQRSHPQLACLQTRITAERLILRDPHLGELELPLEPLDWGIEPNNLLQKVPLQKVRVWKRDILAYDTGDAAAEFVSKIVNQPARLMRASKETFPDGYPLLLCTQASLDALNAHLPAALPMNRFRPNIVVSGLEAWQEDTLLSLAIGPDILLRPMKACTRCVMTSVDQETGERGLSPLQVLRQIRYDPALRGVTFGQNLRVDRGFGKTIRVGDQIELSWKPVRSPAVEPEPLPGL